MESKPTKKANIKQSTPKPKVKGVTNKYKHSKAGVDPDVDQASFKQRMSPGQKKTNYGRKVRKARREISK